MARASYYREEARRCRDLAVGSPDPDAAKRWRAIAADYDKLAEAFDDHPATVMRTPMQQQSKTEPDSKS